VGAATISNFVQDRETVKKAFKDKFDVCKQANNVAELAQYNHRLNELKIGEQRLLVKYADPANNCSEEALQGALVEIKGNVTLVKNKITELQSTISTEEEQARKLDDVQEILDTLKDKIPNATFDTKRQIFEQLVKEVRVSKTEDGIPYVKIVYWFDKDLIEANSNGQLHHEPMSVRIFW
jgi:hypothetical protein